MKERIWVVREGEPLSLTWILEKLGETEVAVEEGRVFVGRVRARSPTGAVKVGDTVRVSLRKKAQSAPPRVLKRERDLVFADKPAGLPTIPDQEGGASLLSEVAGFLGLAMDRVHATSRLDRNVSGVVTFALTRGAHKRLLAAREAGTYERRYVALCLGNPAQKEGVWDFPIGRALDPRHRKVNGRDATLARSRFEVTGEVAGFCSLALFPETGRTHQLRVHAAHVGLPMLGDATYGGPSSLTLPSGTVLSFGRIALHAASVKVPSESGTVEVLSALPEEFGRWWQMLARGVKGLDET